MYSYYPPAYPPPYPAETCPVQPGPPNWDWGFHRVVSFLQSPPVGAGILSIAFFLLVVFSSNVILAWATTLKLLGISVTISTFILIALVILILFVL